MTATLERTPAPLAPTAGPRPPGRPYAAWLLALLAFGIYLAAAIWLRYDLDFAIGDAVARTAEAKYIVLSRDAHAAALGFYWMPIPTVVQVPFVLLLQPFGQAEFAGPLSTVLWGTGTVLVLARMARDLGLPQWLGLSLTAAYAFNPVTIYYSANGMGEAALLLFLALMLSGVLTYLQRGSERALVRAAVGLLGAVLSRYEATPLLLVIPPVVALADLRRHDRSKAWSTLAVTAIPATVGIAVWVFYMRYIGGSFTAFRESSDAVGGGPGGAGGGGGPSDFRPDYYAGATGSTAHALDWTGHWLLLYGPGLLVLPLLLLPPVRRSLGTLAVLATTAVVPAITVELLRREGTTGEPRYFVAFTVLAAVAAIWCAARLRPCVLPVRVVTGVGLLALLALGAVTGSEGLKQVDATRYNGEARVFRAAFGGDAVPDGIRGGILPPWREFTERMDRTVPRGQLVLADTFQSFPAALLSSRTSSFVMNSDRDYAAQTAPTGVQRFDWAILPVGVGRDTDDAVDVVDRAAPGTWREAFTVGAASLWQRVAPAGPDGVPQLDG